MTDIIKENLEVFLHSFLLYNNLKSSINSRNIDIVKYFLHKGSEITKDCIMASILRDPKILELLIESGADVNVNNGEPIIWASFCFYTETVKVLVKNGADVQVNYNHLIKNTSEYDIMDFIIKKGADIHVDDDYPLRMWAGIKVETNARNSLAYSSCFVELLLESGANVNVLDDWCIKKSAFNGNIETVEILIKYGADFKKVKRARKNVVDLLEKMGCNDIEIIPEPPSVNKRLEFYHPRRELTWCLPE
jgi:ankyrin repeat protein